MPPPQVVEEYYPGLGRRIRAARVDAGVTQEELGHALDKGRQGIWQIENAHVRVYVHQLVIIARALGVPVTALLGGKW